MNAYSEKQAKAFKIESGLAKATAARDDFVQMFKMLDKKMPDATAFDRMSLAVLEYFGVKHLGMKGHVQDKLVFKSEMQPVNENDLSQIANRTKAAFLEMFNEIHRQMEAPSVQKSKKSYAFALDMIVDLAKFGDKYFGTKFTEGSEFVKPELVERWKREAAINRSDEWGAGLVDTVVIVMKALSEGKTPKDAWAATKGMDGSGATDGIVAQAITEFHPRGEEFRTYWNGLFGLKDSKGVAQPALLKVERDQQHSNILKEIGKEIMTGEIGPGN
jgi:hypothetical protein